jgi:rSAM/selenodomain-associated transferase 1
MRPILVILAKAPLRGTVKPGLEARLGAEGALALHRALLEDAACQFGSVAAGAVKVRIAATPDVNHPELAELVKRYGGGLIEQGPGSLGDRIARLQAQLFTPGVPSVTFVGTDAPTLPLVHVNDAWKRLEKHEVALGPCEDGGFYLYGSTLPTSEAFEGVEWGTARTLDRIRENLRRAGRTVTELPGWWDVDRPEDLERLQASLAEFPTRAPTTAKALRQLLGSR